MKRIIKSSSADGDYFTAIKEYIEDDEAAEIVYNWYNNEGAFEDFDTVEDFIYYMSSDIHDMLDAAQGEERKLVERALGE